MVANAKAKKTDTKAELDTQAKKMDAKAVKKMDAIAMKKMDVR